ncbi:cytochrome c oxidase assembly protein [Arthrobacter psychrolactophilus]|uniref:Cytochrome c oxidase assembly protein n=1 Tax=Arthrobacter psychrolactophilus TaxID=92442 RepID=A0A2V5JI16_9MICC|nr:cytochrome c oxidase assembly protein [Arthrobacter psychrolactophilus]PYI39777.1 cytochrome c oxidase assembly protein [Arthrobacter psychrolactophilus]
MPAVGVFWSTWSLDPWALALILAAAGLYVWGLYRAAAVGVRWPVWRVAAFFTLGLGLYAVVSFGFLGTWSAELRWAFSLRIAICLFVVPAGLALGLPVALARIAVRQGRLRTVLAAVGRWPMRCFSNSAIAPVIGLLVLSMMLTPLAGITRINPVFEGLLSVAIPLLGLLMVVPLVEEKTQLSTGLIMVQFVFAFIELLADAMPGLIMRLSPGILDGATLFSGSHPAWFPTALADQQLGGDFLWFIAEIMDLPVLILLFLRFATSDKGERKVLDALSDEHMAELNDAHLKLRR